MMLIARLEAESWIPSSLARLLARRAPGRIAVRTTSVIMLNCTYRRRSLWRIGRAWKCSSNTFLSVSGE